MTTVRFAPPPAPGDPAPLRLSVLADLCRASRVGPVTDPVVAGVTHDSRRVRPGDLFAALPGAHLHGVTRAAEAVAAGAVAVLTDVAGAGRDAGALGVPVLVVPDPRRELGPVAAAVHGHPGRDLVLLGVTGTNGKTTTTYLIDAALRRLGRTTGLVGTVVTRVGDRSWRSAMTTPDAPDLQALLATMRREAAEVVTMECSSHALGQHRLGGLRFDVVAFTNLTREHLDHHGTMEEYFAAKARLFTPELARAGIVVVDDPWGRRLAAQARIPIVTLAGGATGAAEDADADWRVLGEPGDDAFVLSGPAGDLPLRTPLPGEHNRIDTAVAALALLRLGFPPRRVVDALEGPVAVPGRMQSLDLGPGAPTAVVDFAHTPDAVAATAGALRRRTTGRLVVTVSAGGDRDRGKRGPIGEAAVRSGAEVLVLTDDHPRTEDPAAIRADVMRGIRAACAAVRAAGGTPPLVVEVAEGRRRALDVALAAAGPTGTVAFLGLGPDRHQHIGPRGHLVPFVETDEIRAAWARISAGAAEAPAQAS